MNVRAMRRIAPMLLPTLILGACAVVDRKDYQPQLDPAATGALHGRFACMPAYVSHAIGFEGPPDLAEILGGVECDTAILETLDGPAWLVSLERYGITSVPRRIDAGQGLERAGTGPFSLPSRSNCGAGSWSGCHDARTLIFVDTRGDLIIVQKRGDEGLLTRLPVGLVGQRVAIFPRTSP